MHTFWPDEGINLYFVTVKENKRVVAGIMKRWHVVIVLARTMMSLRASVNQLSSSIWTLHSRCQPCVVSLKLSWISHCMIMSSGCKTVSRFNCVSLAYLWPPCLADVDIIFLPCGFFFFFYLLFLLSSSNLSRRRVDVCHTSTHGVALVRI